MIDVCCLQEVRLIGQGVGMLGMKGRRHNLWGSGKGNGVVGVGVIWKKELCEKVMEVRRVSGRVTAVVLFLKRMY